MNRPTIFVPNRMEERHLQTFQIASPIATHTRVATCEEIECPQYLNGWAIKVDLDTDLGQKQAYYIKNHSGRAFTVAAREGNVATLHFSPNQECFEEHRVPLDRPAVYRVKGGDRRGNPLRLPTRVHKKPEFWVEEFAENQDRIARVHEKG